MSGYWQKDENDNYHYVSYEGIAGLGLIAVAICLFTMTKVVPFFRAADVAIFDNILIVALAATVETGIIALIFRHKFIVAYILNFVHFGVFVFTFAFMARWIGEVEVDVKFLEAIFNSVEFVIRLVISFVVFLLSSVAAFATCINSHREDDGATAAGITFLAILILAAGIGAFALLNHWF